MDANLDDKSQQYRQECYSENKPDSCHLLGEYFEHVKDDLTKAGKIYQTNCDEFSFGKSCQSFANLRFGGKGTTEDMDQALKYYEKGCKADYVDSCLYGGIMCVSTSSATKAITKDYKKGVELLDKACSNESAFACHYLSGMFSVGVEGEKHLVKSKDKSFQYAMKACDKGNMFACSNISLMYTNGDGVEKDLAKGMQFRDKYLELRKKAIASMPNPHGGMVDSRNMPA